MKLCLRSQGQDRYEIHKICKLQTGVLSSIWKIISSVMCEIKHNTYAHIFACKSYQFQAIVEGPELILWFAAENRLSKTGNWCPKWQAKAHVSRTGFRQNWGPILRRAAHYLDLNIFLRKFTPVLSLCQAMCSCDKKLTNLILWVAIHNFYFPVSRTGGLLYKYTINGMYKSIFDQKIKNDMFLKVLVRTFMRNCCATRIFRWL